MTNIIGYFHICQKGEWKKSFTILFNCIKNYGLYNATKEIRCGITSDSGKLIPYYKFNDPKIKIIFIGDSNLYERPTLMNMRAQSEIDDKNTVYWYLHTKGLRHFNTPKESFVLDWIKLMLYWNVRKWKLALKKLNSYDTYGCNNLDDVFYSGNFWWANNYHIRKLPLEIGYHYTAPEAWLFSSKPNFCEIYSSGIQGDGHYEENFPITNYYSTKDLKNVLPDYFNYENYKILNNLPQNMKRKDVINHYLNIGKKLNLKYISDKENNDLLPVFDVDGYRLNNIDLRDLTDEELINHWNTHGKFEKRKFVNEKIPDDFDFDLYRSIYNDLSSFDDEMLKYHWLNYGKFEDRIYSLNLIKDDKNCLFLAINRNLLILAEKIINNLSKDIISHVDKNNNSALILAINKNYSDLANKIINSGHSNPCIINKQNNNALLLALSLDQLDVVENLILNTDIKKIKNAKNNYNSSSVDIARSKGLTHILKLLEE